MELKNLWQSSRQAFLFLITTIRKFKKSEKSLIFGFDKKNKLSWDSSDDVKIIANL
jgi:hypothetical protein